LKNTTFFIDRSLGRYDIPNYLKSKGLKVEIHDDHFAPQTKDEEWLECVGRKGWIVITKDKHIRTRNNEKQMVQKHAVAVFALTRGEFNGTKMAQIIEKALDKIIKAVEKEIPPYIFSITKSSNIKKLI